MTYPAAATSNQVFIPLPTSQVDQGTRAWGNDLVNQLRKQLTQLKSDISNASGVDESTLSRIDNLEAAITELNAVLGTYETLTAQQKYILSLVSATDSVIGSMADHAKNAWEEAQKAAMNDGLSMLKSYIDNGKNRTAVINEQIVRISEDAALAQQVTATNASLAQTNANVTAVQQAYVAGDNALATSLNSVSTQVAGNTASITTLQTSYDGIKAKWSVQLNVQGQATGLVSLDGTGNQSTFAVVASNFYVAQPSTTGGDPNTVFAIGNRNGTPALGIRADMYLDGSIIARHLSVSTLSAITGNVGTLTAGYIQDHATTPVFRMDIPNGWQGRVDGSSFLDFKNNILQFTA